MGPVEAPARTVTLETEPPQVSVGVGRHEPHRPNALIGLGLAVLIGVVVFVVFWKLRKTFGMKE